MSIANYRHGAAWSAVAAAIICAAPAAAQPAQRADYSLPAQELSRSLREVSVRSSTSIIAPSELIAGRRAPPLQGRFSPREALERLLAGSGLGISEEDGTLIVTRLAEQASAAPDALAPSQSEPIVVTGSNIRGGQSTSPVIVLGRADIDRSGATSVEQLMRIVPQNSQSGVNQENFLVTGAGVDSTEHGAGLNLRGLGQRATLVLVDGRRVAPSGAGSFVDVSLLPLSAVQRVEILTDGASAIYGSDAVGGVVNFILRRDFEGLETNLQAGTATRGDGDRLVLGLTGGTNWGSGRVMLAYEYRLEDEIEARDRPFTINLRPETTILPRERRHSLFGLVNQELAPGLELDASGSYSHRNTERTYFTTGFPQPAAAVATAEVASATATLSYRFGSNWLVRASAGWSRSTTEEMQTQPGGQELINRFDSRAQIVDLGLQADGSLFALPGGDVKLAFGALGRRERHFDLFSTQTTPAREKRAERDVGSLFGEVEVPLFSSLNRTPGFERLTLTGAVRYEYYEGSGGSVDPKFGLLWSPLPGVTLRGTWGTSFRAPLLSETVGLYNVFYYPAALLTIVGTPPGGVALATGGTNPGVGPERSRSWTAGIELEPRFAPGFRLRVNYYDIRFSDRIALPAPTIAVIGNPAYEPIIDRSPTLERINALLAGAGRVLDLSGPNFTPGGATPQSVTVIVDNRFGNTAVSATNGLDFLASYAFDIGPSRFVAELNANHILTFDEQLTVTAPVLAALNRPFRPSDLHLRGGLTWAHGGWSANLYVNHTDGYADDRRPVVRPVGSFTTADFGISYTFGADGPGRERPFRIALSVENLFDENPPRLLPDPISTAGLGYDPVNASGRGRAVTLQLRKAW